MFYTATLLFLGYLSDDDGGGNRIMLRHGKMLERVWMYLATR